MAAFGVGVAGSWVPISGVVGFFIVLLLLSIFLTALCSECSRRSFALRDSEAGKDPSALIKVAKLEETMVVTDNPMIDENLKDETDFNSSKANTVSFTPWRSHLGPPQNHHDGQTNGIAEVKNTASNAEAAEEWNPEEENPVPITLWRSHLNQDLNNSTADDHIYHSIGGGRSSNAADLSSPLSTHEPGEEPGGHSAALGDSVDVNSVYARVSKKERPAAFPVRTPVEVLVEEEEVSSPPLPDRKTQLEA